MLLGYEIPDFLMRKMRSSVMLAGAILGRFRKAIFSYPGGCEIGTRPIDLHLNVMKQLGINIEEDGGFIYCDADKICGSEINLDFPSVGATENAILSSVFCEGETIIKNAAREPEIIDLQNFLNSMGANVKGAGNNMISITGIKKLHNTSYYIMEDRIEAATFLCAACSVSKSSIELVGINKEYVEPILYKLKESGCKISVNRDIINVEKNGRLKSIDSIKTMPYPGFPTDAQSAMVAMLCTCRGTSIVIENIFENRYKYVNELLRMGAKITTEGKTAIIKGVKKLKGAIVNSTDLRGGAALIIAGLGAQGRTEINNISYILRGYDNIDKKLSSIGGNIILSS